MKYAWTKKVASLLLVFVVILMGGCGSIKNSGNINSQKNSTEIQKSTLQNNVVNAENPKGSRVENNEIGKSDPHDKNASNSTTVESVPAKSTPTKFNNESIPVLMYHSVMYEKGNELRIPKEKFYEEMKYLKDNDYTTLTMDELYDFLVSNKPVPEKSIVITFDDGYVDNYTNAYPVLKEFGFKATIFMITCTVDTDSSYLTSSELKELEANGIQIEGHTVKHDELNKLSYSAQLKTLTDSKKFLDDLLNKDVKYMAYPFGHYNADTIKAAKEAGYKMIFTTMGGWANKKDGIMTLNRVYISSLATMDNFKYRITHPDYSKQ